MTQDPNALLNLARCYKCIPRGYQWIVVIYLLDRWAQKKSNTAPDAPAAQQSSDIAAAGFTANWSASAGATGYRLDVSTDPAFGSFVVGYQDKDVGNVTTLAVVGLAKNIYYYRVRAYNASSTSDNSSVITTAVPVLWLPITALCNYNDGAAHNGQNLTQFLTATMANVNSLTLNNTAITRLDIAGCANLTNLIITNNASLTSVIMPGIKTTVTSLSLGTNAALTTLSIPNVTLVGSGPILTNCASLVTLSMPAVQSMGTWFVDHCTSLTTISVPLLNNTGGITANFSPMISTLTFDWINLSLGDFASYIFTGCSLVESAIANMLHAGAVSGLSNSDFEFLGANNASIAADAVAKADAAALVGGGCTVNVNGWP